MSLKIGGGSSKSTETWNKSGTSDTTATLPDWLKGPTQGILGQVGNFSNIDPQSLVAGPSGLQTQAFDAASGLLGGQHMGLLGGAANLAAAAGTAGPNLAAGGSMPGAATATMPNLGPAALAQFGGGAEGAGATAGRIGNTRGYTAAQTEGLANGGIGAVTLGPAAQAQQRSLLGMDLAGYQNPYQQQVIDAAMADADAEAERARTALKAQGAKAGAFGGSRFGLAGAELEGQLGRARSSLLSGLLSEGFDKATGLATADLDRLGLTDRFNAGETNDLTEAQGGLDMQGLGLNAEIGMANTAATNEASQFGADAANKAAIAQAGLDTDASIASANNATQAAVASMDAQTRIALQNAQSVNDRAALLASLGVDVSKFNAGEINNIAMEAARLGQQNNQFNAGQMDNALNRGLTAAGLLGDIGNSYGNNQRADIGLLGDLGATQRGITQDGLLAGLNLTKAQVDMLQPFLSALTGQSQTVTESGTSTTKGSKKDVGFGISWSDATGIGG